MKQCPSLIGCGKVCTVCTPKWFTEDLIYKSVDGVHRFGKSNSPNDNASDDYDTLIASTTLDGTTSKGKL